MLDSGCRGTLCSGDERSVRSGCDTFGFGRDRQAEWRFQEELRRDCRSHSLPAFDKCSSASIVLVASLDGRYRTCVGLLVAMNEIDNTAREMNMGSKDAIRAIPAGPTRSSLPLKIRAPTIDELSGLSGLCFRSKSSLGLRRGLHESMFAARYGSRPILDFNSTRSVKTSAAWRRSPSATIGGWMEWSRPQ